MLPASASAFWSMSAISPSIALRVAPRGCASSAPVAVDVHAEEPEKITISISTNVNVCRFQTSKLQQTTKISDVPR